MKINSTRGTVTSLEESLMISRNLEAERWMRYSNLKMRNQIMMDDLKKANKRNKNMLNLFRQSVTDIRFGSEIALPESLKREVQRTWHQKYDALLTKNEQLKGDLSVANSLLKEKTHEINNLQQKLLTLGDSLFERNQTVENICKKYLALKKRKDEQEILLRGSIETLQLEINKKYTL
ncbi:hypothetical protein WH47_07991 [Habropoda laboriosa]|uniref:Uncharacterized protein n=2 Tax=Habropoda laboriosa TaxID=597456 RepID=A0A0L7QPS6_9HYME|nr:hypothetical protein WH47_07991 [Habropoda laboriosa]